MFVLGWGQGRLMRAVWWTPAMETVLALVDSVGMVLSSLEKRVIAGMGRVTSRILNAATL
ncbi:uncharacterized protein N7529_006469 [Penicillium soppii]|uniref:uncharacterized protein n=1 Tax=Penicillium soppii TaxID=69789 RepID=UPI00254859F8|nr:uncharacterized protein N7529_006469 [Penicillium soppii]KAJ5864553.1 hypothetical protein N7529_006469 [Penicillium soppii]